MRVFNVILGVVVCCSRLLLVVLYFILGICGPCIVFALLVLSIVNVQILI